MLAILTRNYWAALPNSSRMAVQPPPLWIMPRMASPPASRSRYLCGECLVPDAVQVSPQGGHAVRVELVHPARALGPADHEPAVLEHAQVLGYRRAADRQLPRQLPDRARPPGEQLEYRSPGRITEQAEPAIPVSIH